MVIAGIDGGGTHTRLELRDDENRLLSRTEFGPFNLNAIGEAAFRRLLRQVLAACGDMANCARLCVGGAGISNPAVGAILGQELERAGFSGMWKLCGDQEIALRGAMDTPGVVVIAGTGSICFGRNGAGQTARSGGYGHLISQRGDSAWGYGGWWSYEHAGTRGTFAIENCTEKLLYWNPQQKDASGRPTMMQATLEPEVYDTGIKSFNATFPVRINAWLEDLTNKVPREHIRASGRDALATLEYTFAAIQSYENGGELVVPHKLPALHGDTQFVY